MCVHVYTQLNPLHSLHYPKHTHTQTHISHSSECVCVCACIYRQLPYPTHTHTHTHLILERPLHLSPITHTHTHNLILGATASACLPSHASGGDRHSERLPPRYWSQLWSLCPALVPLPHAEPLLKDVQATVEGRQQWWCRLLKVCSLSYYYCNL